MRKISVSFVAALVLLASVVSCQTASPPPPPMNDEECPIDDSKEVTINVDAYAGVDRECVQIKRGAASVIWTTADTNVADLRVKFVRPTEGKPKPPDDPRCSGRRCVLDKAKHAQKKGEFPYLVQVTWRDGTSQGQDPKLVIRP